MPMVVGSPLTLVLNGFVIVIAKFQFVGPVFLFSKLHKLLLWGLALG